MHLGNDSKIRPYYEKAPIYLDFRIYLFNVTNKEEVIEGGEYYLLLEIVGFFFFFLKQISLFFFLQKNQNWKRLDRISSSAWFETILSCNLILLNFY